MRYAESPEGTGIRSTGSLGLIFEKLTMTAGAFKEKRVGFDSVNQEPIWLDMTISGASQKTGQWVIAVARFQGLPGGKSSDYEFQLFQVLSLPSEHA